MLSINYKNIIKPYEIIIAIMISTIFIVPILPMIMNLESESLNVILRIIFILVALLSLTFIIYNNKVYIGYAHVLLLFFLSLYIIRIIYDSNIEGRMTRNDVTLYYYYILISIVMPTIILFCKIKFDYEKIEKHILFITTILSIVTIYKLIGVIGTEFGRIDRDIYGINPLMVGYLGTFVSVLSINKYIRRGLSILIVISFILGVLCIGLSGSRGPFISFVLTSAFIIALTDTIGTKYKIIYAIVMAIILFISIQLMTYIGSDALIRFIGTTNRIQTGGESRVEYLSTSLILIKENMIFGYGIELPSGKIPHNLIIESFLSTGVIGGMMFVLIYIIGIIKSLSLLRESNKSGIASLFIVVSIWSLFSSTLYYLVIYWMLYVLINKK